MAKGFPWLADSFALGLKQWLLLEAFLYTTPLTSWLVHNKTQNPTYANIHLYIMQDSPLWNLGGIGHCGRGDVSTSKHQYLAEAYLHHRKQTYSFGCSSAPCSCLADFFTPLKHLCSGETLNVLRSKLCSLSDDSRISDGI
jgi:hypothetical protein